MQSALCWGSGLDSVGAEEAETQLQTGGRGTQLMPHRRYAGRDIVEQRQPV